MSKKKIRPPFILLIISALLVGFGLVYQYFILVTIPEQTQIDNVILNAIPFISIFIAILLVYIFIINLSAQILGNWIPVKVYRPINLLLISGILISILMLMQPFSIVLYRISFPILLFSLFGFILWSHITPRNLSLEEKSSN